MNGKYHISFFTFFTFYLSLLTFHFSSSAIFAAEPNVVSADTIRIKMLHIFIQADVNDVRFDNIWVFENRQRGESWDVSIDLPDRAVLLSLDEPNETEFLADSLSLRKRIAADSIIDSVGFSFVLPNQDGLCRTSVKPGYQVNSVVVSVSGPASQFTSNVLKLTIADFMASRDRLPRIYTAGNLAAEERIEINLSRLPHRDCKLPEVLCAAGLALIVIAALFTIYYNKTETNKSCSNETTLK